MARRRHAKRRRRERNSSLDTFALRSSKMPGVVSARHFDSSSGSKMRYLMNVLRTECLHPPPPVCDPRPRVFLGIASCPWMHLFRRREG
ncbi:hypothetical protein DBV15_00014 [Temnothorax longispinosus]|uniref:Uncharacterized protein n=1 Tax=Temnothorax longispinosus TaxID=300112 RepID=A0A4S2KE00_9HYME|nr:hypothetical protein DBV15_00014 [Temnothorax longispinosus]